MRLRPTRLRACGMGLVLCVLSQARAVSAQQARSTLDLGTANMRYADSVGTSAVSVSPSIRIDWTQVLLRAAGTYAQLGSGGWSTQGTLGLSALTPKAGPLSGELVLVTGGSAHFDGARTGQTLGLARLHVDESSYGLWAGGGVGRTWDGVDWHAMQVGELGLSARTGSTVLGLTAAPTFVDDTIRYVDTEVAARWRRARFEAEASLGVRAGQRLPDFGGSARSWGGVSGLAWLTSRLALVASAGTYAVDLTQGFPGGRYLTLALRISSSGPPATAFDYLTTAREGAAPGPSSAITSLVVEKRSGSERTIRFRASGATQVELIGDFTGWQPVRLTPSGNSWWSITLPLHPGNYQMNVRLNGSAWQVPDDLLAIKDEFGGTVGLLVISP